jgi:hypothetical protein
VEQSVQKRTSKHGTSSWPSAGGPCRPVPIHTDRGDLRQALHQGGGPIRGRHLERERGPVRLVERDGGRSHGSGAREQEERAGVRGQRPRVGDVLQLPWDGLH